jgi:hypothetical protein
VVDGYEMEDLLLGYSHGMAGVDVGQMSYLTMMNWSILIRFPKGRGA